MPFRLVINHFRQQTALQSVKVFSIEHKTLLEQEKAHAKLFKLNSLVPITELYGDLMKGAASPVKSDIDILVSAIFSENILVQKFNAHINPSAIKSLSKEATSLKFGRFTPEE